MSSVRRTCRVLERCRNSADRSKSWSLCAPNRTFVHSGACLRAHCLHALHTCERPKGILVVSSGVWPALTANPNIGLRVSDESAWTGIGFCIATVTSVSKRGTNEGIDHAWGFCIRAGSGMESQQPNYDRDWSLAFI